MLDRCHALLREAFGYGAFRPGQRDVIAALGEGRDVLAVMPTGAGKSLCYQLPALVGDGLTLVISPLQALMKDQVQALKRRGLGGVDFLNGLMTPEEQSACLRELGDRELKLLYVAPERFASPGFLRALAKNVVTMVAIDEAHCISQWGHDFRPEYRELQPLLAQQPKALRLALTATATPRVRDDIAASLGLRDPLRVVLSADRPNLRFEVEPCPSKKKPERVAELVREIAGPTIVYAGKRADAEDLAQLLREHRVKALAYHAGLPPDERHRVQDAFLSGKTQVVCATIAFGMGIDKPDVRGVIHHRHPSTLEAYYQEAGRAGRDGLPARCVLLSAEKDAALHRYFIQNAYPTLDEHRGVYKLVRAGVPADEMESHDAELTASKVKVALRTLEAQGFLERDGWSYRIVQPEVKRTLDLSHQDLQRDHAFGLVEHMIAYAQSPDCLRARILKYFGESAGACGNCSVCRGRPTALPKKKRRKREAGPDCPDCGGETRRRRNRADEPFWGCARYPACKGTVNIDEDALSA